MIDEEATFKKFGYYSGDLSPKSRKKIVAVCDDCGKVRIVHKGNYHALCRSCGHKGEKIKRICQQCGKEFFVLPSVIKKGFGKFCSLKCVGKWQSEHLSGKNISQKGGKVKCVCEQCGKEFFAKTSVIKRGGAKFCSNECRGKWQSEYQSGENNPVWKGGISFEPYCEKFDEPFREYIREKFNRVCFLCPTTEEENGRRLSVHHVNYNKDCMCDGDLTCQFVPLCLSCNSKANFNRKTWTKKIMALLQEKLNGWYI